ncbi:MULTISPECIES: phosphatidylglycerophosphatase A [unclassified Nitratiruptor]|uniref:phosphatidylglycerophosphatase A family protein n=1 Tax=unclassified Nitratiruptor TaxID=2624044 RepID=UPI0019167B86|nr:MULTISPECIES: phosphatidylglycerophosphatase A [unclassified Nitratiruptor]BCD59892.1 phosphatidylglycerophosphatase A [Nitratiruptor sp. YY08-10]BCD63815.1 phosphatidylglycerophosphatase A [Nitratiruptor sp. YY08-14]
MRRFFLTGCYTGTLPKAPGTWGTLFGAIIGAFLLHFLPQSSLFLLVILITIIGIKEINIYEKQTNTHDDPSIVIDEIAGIWLAYSILPSTHLIWLVVAFILFRILDITKPSYIKKLDSMPGGLGVMADDLLAGVLAGLLTGLIYVGAEKLL